ncbi:MAG: VWA domain-containing protein [Bacteroidota bacterium]|nr:VWA domain-containing protein [Rhodothermia bacterium]MCS7154370.1 VWA domain-containing protein [Bacteroidota bacterium]MDW8137745.1 VWA domain-containing protein [Bacteroidota bacterium]MDW8286405.1 VWA domain-containing protein [Bacteroidota bacterium]
MHFLYEAWNEAQQRRESAFGRLFRLFQELLLHTAGDAQEALHWLTQLDRHYRLTDPDYGIGDFIEELQERGYLREEEPGRVQLTPKSERSLRQRSLEEVFSKLRKRGLGRHPTPHLGLGEEPQPETRPWQFGDNVQHIDHQETFRNAFRRYGLEDFRLDEETIAVRETDHHASTATVLLLDVSHSMVLYGEDRITPAKKVALALAELITSQYPQDKLDIIAFGNEAWPVAIRDLPYLEVGPYYTNTLAALERARQILRRRRGMNKQIVLITDGKPSAMFIGGRLYKNPYGLDRRIVNRVLDAAIRCRREQITITTFMVARDAYLQAFVHEFTRLNQGRAYYAALDKLGEYVLEDFIRNRRKRVR